MDLSQFLDVLRARWKFAVTTMGIGVVVTVITMLQVPPTYGSSATLLISASSSSTTESYALTFLAAQRADSYADLAKSSEVLIRVSAQLGNDLSVAELAGQVDASVVENTSLLRLDARASSPELAQQIVTAESDEIIRIVKKLETQIAKDSPMIVANVASKPSFSTTPVAPSLALSLGVGLMLSFLIGIAGALVRDKLDISVKTREDIEEITENSPLVTLPYDRGVKKNPLVMDDPFGPLNEAFSVLRTNLQFSNLDAQRQMLVVSSALPDEGKTFVATNLAISMAKGGRSVLLVDADMRNPNVAELLGLPNSVGLVTVLLGRTTLGAAVQEHSSGVNFLGTGFQPPNPAEVLDTQNMRDLLDTLRENYDVVIIDAPPILPVADAAILATEVDGVLLLARYGATSRDQLQQAVSRIDGVGGRVLGAILNRTPRGALDAYGYGYGYGYGTSVEQPRSTPVVEDERPARRFIGGSRREVKR